MLQPSRPDFITLMMIGEAYKLKIGQVGDSDCNESISHKLIFHNQCSELSYQQGEY